MEKQRALTRGGAWLVAGNVLENLALFLLNLAVARAYGSSDHGRFVLALALVSLLRLLLDAGLGPALTRLLAGGAGRPALARAGLLALLVNVPAALAVAAVAGRPADSGSPGPAGAAFGLWFATLAIQSLAASAFNGLQAMRLAFLAGALPAAAQTACAAWLLLARPAFPFFLAGANLLMAAAGVGIFLLLAGKTVSLPRGDAPPPAWGALLRLSFLLWIPSAAMAALSQALPLLIGFRLGAGAASHYSVLASWSLLAAVALTPLANAFFAWSARHGGDADPALPGIRAGYFRAVGAAALACAALLTAGAGLLLGIYGTEYAALKPVFLVLVLSQLAEYPRFLTTPLLGAGARAGRASRIETARVIATLAAAALALFLGRSLAALAWTLLAVQATFGILRLLDARDALGFAPLPAFAKVMLGGAAVFALGILPLPPAVGPALTAAVLALLVFRLRADLRGVYRALAAR